MRIKWETSSNGLNATLVVPKPIQTPNPVGVAYQKATEIERVRAAFGGEWIGFEPYVRLWIKEGKDATGLTVLMHSYPKDQDTGPLPDVCVRWAEWRGHRAIEEFVAADDKRRYVRDDLPVECVLRFYRSVEIGIEQLMERTSKVLAGGVSFTKMDRPDRREVAVEFCDGLLFYQFSFSPGGFSSEALEGVVREWVEYARSLRAQHDYPPDEDFQVVYRESLWERIARYDEPRPEKGLEKEKGSGAFDSVGGSDGVPSG
jgi:hypothetical protein